MFRDLLARDPRLAVPQFAQISKPSFDKSTRVVNLHLHCNGIRYPEAYADRGELLVSMFYW